MNFRHVVYATWLAACGSSEPVTSGNGGADGGVGATGGGDGGGFSAVYDEAGNLLCQVLQVDSGRVRPEMLIVLDRSSSMQGRGVDRWTPSVAGIKSITRNLDSRVDFGLMAFPGRGTSGVGAGQACAAGTIEVPVMASSAQAISQSLDGLQLVQTTPTAASLDAARGALDTTTTDVDITRVAQKYVVLVTDGAPNCSDGASGGNQGAGPDPAALDATVAAIEALSTVGVDTYVLGFGTKDDVTLAAALDRMAVAGATGDTAHRTIEDEAQIVAEFQRIAGDTLSCVFTLASAPDDASYVAITLDGALLGLGDPNGWSLGADGKTVTLQGSACALVKDPLADHALSVEVRCAKVTLG